MDNLSRENNNGSMLPMAGVIVGVLALILSAVALAKISTAKTDLNTEIATANDNATAASRAATEAGTAVKSLQRDQATNNGNFKAIQDYITTLAGDIKTLQEAAKKPVVNNSKPSENVVAGKDEYIVKAGDTSGKKIADANGVKLADLMAVNPSVDWTKLKIGQKLKLPAKK